MRKPLNKSQAVALAKRWVSKPRGSLAYWTVEGPEDPTVPDGPTMIKEASDWWEAMGKMTKWRAEVALRSMGVCEHDAAKHIASHFERGSRSLSEIVSAWRF